jgi:hypothetical protein
MTIELGVWKVTDSKATQRVAVAGIDIESRLEDILAHDISIAHPGWLVIGRQVQTAYNKFIDLLAIDSAGDLIILELKKDKTSREVVAQVLDYGSWVRDLKDDDIGKIFEAYKAKYAPHMKGKSLNEVFEERFHQPIPSELNSAHSLVVATTSVDSQTQRIVDYLWEDYNVDINVMFFNFFQSQSELFLVRDWLNDMAEEKPSTKGAPGKGSWNGEYYVSFMDATHRKWQDAIKYGFVSAGGGAWYSKTLGMLEPGDRIWVNMPGTGYVGVGTVEDNVVPVDEFMVMDTDGQAKPIREVVSSTQGMPTKAEHGDNAEHLVKVTWLHTVPMDKAIKEVGFFGNQNSVARPKAEKWNYTIERLKKRFGVE